MRSVTSFFSPTLYKKHLTRFWPMWAAWLTVWVLGLPLNLLSTSQWTTEAVVRETVKGYGSLCYLSSVLIMLMAPVAAVAVFSYLFKAPAAGFMGALPLRREGVFAASWLAGYTILAAPLAAVSLLTLLVELMIGAVDPSILTWLGASLLELFFYFSFAALCCVISGSGVGGAAFYIIFNGVVIVMMWLVQGMLSNFLYGFRVFSDGVWEAVTWLTPVVRLGERVAESPQLFWEAHWVYAGTGFLMLLGAIGLHHIRRSERAGDLIAFKPLRYAFKVCMILCGGLSFGMLMATLFVWNQQYTGAAVAVCCGVAAGVFSLISDMLLQKTLRVFKKGWKWALISLFLFVLVISAVDMDWIGFTTRVPEGEQVRGVHLQITSNRVNRAAAAGLVYTGEEAEPVRDLHRYLIDHRRELTAGGDRVNYYNVELVYNLGWSRITRRYGVYCGMEDPLNEVIGTAVAAGTPQVYLTLGAPHRGEFICMLEDGKTQGYLQLTPEELQTVWKALVDDIDSGWYRAPAFWEGGEDWFEFFWIDGEAVVHQTVYRTGQGPSLEEVIRELDLPARAGEGGK